jgi:hypothetical protein
MRAPKLALLALLVAPGRADAVPPVAHGAPPDREPSAMSSQPRVGSEASSKQALLDAFRNTVRYALLKTRRDVAAHGVVPARFTVEALDDSLGAPENAAAFAEAPSRTIKAIVERARTGPVTCLFRWRPAPGRDWLRARFQLTLEPHWLDVRLLWLELPEKVPVAPSVGEIDGRKPIAEAVAQKLELLPDGNLAIAPQPQ